MSFRVCLSEYVCLLVASFRSHTNLLYSRLSHQSALLTPILLFLTLLRSFAFRHSGSLAVSLACFTPGLSPTQTPKKNLAERGGERKACDGAGSICVVVTLALIVVTLALIDTAASSHQVM